ncbi:MAG: 2-dehydropantoate 2-reductase, partial [Alphaproteobacteria bacterium]|nr:2-dehydropantoate 2-reductase [Alphaproteobacteria bacterium]
MGGRDLRFAIYGAGGVGGYFGARLAAAGEEVHFVARGAHLEAIRENGLKVLSPLGDMLVEPAGVTADPHKIGPVDVVLVAVKLYDAQAAEAGCHALIGPRTMVVPLQNGVGAMDAFAAALGAERVLGGIAYIASHIEAPGVIRHIGTLARLVVGEANGAMTPRVEALWGAFDRAGIDAAISPHIQVDIWTKFAFLASFSGVTALTRLPIGPIRGEPETRALLRDAVSEVVAV